MNPVKRIISPDSLKEGAYEKIRSGPISTEIWPGPDIFTRPAFLETLLTSIFRAEFIEI